MLRRIYSFLSSSKLALGLLVAVFGCCVAGVTVLRGPRAWTYIFNTLWFNGLLVLLVVNVAFCFFPRMWGRRMTTVLFGMVLFHISFVVILAGIIYNSQVYFRGKIRLTEGEVLRSGDLISYDEVDQGRFFKFADLKGETKLIQMLRGYTLEGQNKKVAYEVEVGEEGERSHGIVYATSSLDHQGFSYFRDKEGYSLLVMLYDKSGEEEYGAFVPLQSFKQPDDSYIYASGSRAGPDYFPFPGEPVEAKFLLKLEYLPAVLTEREGYVKIRIISLPIEDDSIISPGEPNPDDPALAFHRGDGAETEKVPEAPPGYEVMWNKNGETILVPIAYEGEVSVGDKFDTGEYGFAIEEVRYWVSMDVKHEPGQPFVLASRWVSLGGMVITMIGRMKRRKPQVIGDRLSVKGLEASDGDGKRDVQRDPDSEVGARG